MYQSGNAIVTGSDWIAQGLVLAGHALAKGISRLDIIENCLKKND